MRENEPYNSKELVTEEEIEVYNMECKDHMISWTAYQKEIINRLWTEVQDLRSMIMKQKY